MPYTRDEARWIASQYDRPDLGRGMILAFRHAGSPESTKPLSFRGLRPEATYELSCHADGSKAVATGAEWTSGFSATIREPGQSECIVYREVKD